MAMSKSIEEQVEDYFKSELKRFDIQYFIKNEFINDAIDRALKNAHSKSGGTGNNYPDIKVLLTTRNNRQIPVMIEAKGQKNRLVKLDSNGQIELIDKKGSRNSIVNFAVNGAVHYANALLDEGSYKEVLAVGLNGHKLGSEIEYEVAVYYVSENNAREPIELKRYKDLSFLSVQNLDQLVQELDTSTLTEEQKERLKAIKHSELEKAVKAIHQSIYEDISFKSMLSTNDKLFLFSGLIMASLPIDGDSDLRVDDLKGNTSKNSHDGRLILNRIEAFLFKRNSPEDKLEMIIKHLSQVFADNSIIWQPKNGETPIKKYYRQVVENILPILKLRLNVDFTGIILSSLKDWMDLDGDKQNDVVLTPRHVTTLMAKLARTDKDSFVWDTAMGSGGFLIAAMELMIEDVKQKIATAEQQKEKIEHIKKNQLLGIEILPNVFILAVINMILTGDGSAQVKQGDSFNYIRDQSQNIFPYNVFLLNPPYSAEGKGLGFVERALAMMTKGYGCILIQENAGSGNDGGFAKKILKSNTLVASIHMPANLFNGRSSVQTAIYLFEVNRPHDPQSLVTFIDFSDDGYTRQNRKKSTEEVNLRDTNDAKGRYKEIADIILGRAKSTDYFNEKNGTVIRDTITLEGNDWTYAQHKKIDIEPTYEDFKNTVKEYLAWKVSQIIKQEDSSLGKP